MNLEPKSREFSHQLTDNPPTQLLPREAYTGEKWFDREQNELFGKTWSYVGLSTEIPNPGDYVTLNVGKYRLFVVRDESGAIRGFHNLCRHRGTELLEGTGNLDSPRITCPYHRWTYKLDGSLRAVPMKNKCFPDLDLGKHHLLNASVGEFKGLIFIHPDPDQDFSKWIADLGPVAWPHKFKDMSTGPEVIYEMKCNWKVFFENAIDGYHLAYLHDKTLGGPKADLNVWDVHGCHLLWYSIETGKKTCLPEAVALQENSSGSKFIPGTESGEFAGVYMLFPNIAITASRTQLSISKIQPISPGITRLISRQWMPKDTAWKWLSGDDAPVEDYPGYDPETGFLKSSALKQHPLETNDFQWEDVWVCEKMQRSLQSPAYQAGRLAKGAGAESPLEFFQKNVLDFVSLDQQ